MGPNLNELGKMQVVINPFEYIYFLKSRFLDNILPDSRFRWTST